MKKTGNFFKSILPFLAVVALQVAAVLALYLVDLLRTLAGSGGDGRALVNRLLSLPSDTAFLQAANILYGILGLFLFGLWYGRAFVRSAKNRGRSHPGGLSFSAVAALICLAFGLQYVATLAANLTASVNPEWLSQYSALMETSGYEDISLLLALYSVVLAPVVEELVFRGLVFRYARQSLPFWLANLWQALLFGVVHMNIIQGVYAFVIGLFLGWICHRGNGIRYSIPLHIIFNLFGAFGSELFAFTLGISYPLFIGVGCLMTVLGLWLFRKNS